MQPPNPPPLLPPQPPPGLAVPQSPPGAIRVLGILDLVFGIFGLAGTLLPGLLQNNLPLMLLSEGEDGDASPSHPGPGHEPAGIVMAITVITSVMILAAGTCLLLRRRNAVQISNIYAWVSICGKILSFTMSLVPITHLYRESAATGTGFEKFVIPLFIGVLFTALISMIYPVLCLSLLNRQAVKDWLAAHGR